MNRNNEKTLDTKKSGGKETNVNKEKEKTLDTKKSGGKKVEKEKEFNNVTLACDDNEPKMSHKVGINYENGRKDVEINIVNEEGNNDPNSALEYNDDGTKITNKVEGNLDNNSEEDEGITEVTLANDDGKQNPTHKTIRVDKDVQREFIVNEVGNNTLDNNDDGTEITNKVEENQVNNPEEEILSPKREPTLEEKRKMVGKVLEIMTIVSMKNHVYKFGGKIRIQSQGGPIGLGLTGDVADCAMIDWDKKFLRKLKLLNIHPAIYERFKDDITILLERLEKGTIFKEGKLSIDDEKKLLDEGRTDESITLDIIRSIANTIDPMIQLTVDIPGNHENKKLPILDIQACINKTENNRLDYEFYEKPTKNKNVILFDSAIPSKQKRTILTQECLRRLRNTKIDLGQEVQNRHLSEFMVKLKRSGYPEKYRIEVLDSARKAFEKMMKDDNEGVKPLYRSKDWNLEERKLEKRNRKLNWYKNPGETETETKYKSVLFVPVTKGSVLAKEIKQREEEINKYSKERIKITESSGINIKDFLIKKNPFPEEKCKETKCLVCKSETNSSLKIPCNTNNVGYRLSCNTCSSRGIDMGYEGETGRSARIRGIEHLNSFLKDKPDNVFFKHKKMEHINEDMNIKMEITQPFKDALSRQANEAVRIFNRSNNGNKEILNSKSQFNHPPIARVTVESVGQKYPK